MSSRTCVLLDVKIQDNFPELSKGPKKASSISSWILVYTSYDLLYTVVIEM